MENLMETIITKQLEYEAFIRAKAIEIQKEIQENDFSYSEMSLIQTIFEQSIDFSDFKQELKENAII